MLPALVVMLIGVAILYGIFVPACTYPTLRGDALSALFYFANWHYIASGSNRRPQRAARAPRPSWTNVPPFRTASSLAWSCRSVMSARGSPSTTTRSAR